MFRTPPQTKVINHCDSPLYISTINNIADKTGVSKSTIYRMINRGIIVETGCTYGESYEKIYKTA